VARLNADAAVDGILVQLPLPKHIDAKKVVESIDPEKDVYGLHPANAGLLAAGGPPVVAGPPHGGPGAPRPAGGGAAGGGGAGLVGGRSGGVGGRMAQLLVLADATVTIAPSKTRALDDEVGRADILVAAAGKLEMVKGAWIRPGAVVIDVGTNRRDNGKLG